MLKKYGDNSKAKKKRKLSKTQSKAIYVITTTIAKWGTKIRRKFNASS